MNRLGKIMQPLDFTRVFNFEINTLQNHAHNLAMYLAWVNNLRYEFSPNQCLTFLAHAYGYKSFTALNEAIKRNDVFESLQSNEVYLDRLRKHDFSNLFKSQFIQIHDIIFHYIASYIVGSNLDLNYLSVDSPLKGIKLSAEKTSASLVTTQNTSFINTAILNTIVASTFDCGLPETFTIDTRIMNFYDHEQFKYRSVLNGNEGTLILFDPKYIVDSGDGRKLVHLPQETLSNFNKILGKYRHSYSMDNITEPVFKVGKAFAKHHAEHLLDFTNRNNPIACITVEQNDYDLSNEEISEFIQTCLLNTSLANITQFEIDLNLTSIGFNEDNKRKFDYDLAQRLIRCHLANIPFEIVASESITWKGEQYTSECSLQLDINIKYDIDCSQKPNIRVGSISLNSEKGVECHFTLFKPHQDQPDHCLFAFMTLNAPNKMPYENVFTKAIAQHLNKFKFEIATYYTKSSQMQPEIESV